MSEVWATYQASLCFALVWQLTAVAFAWRRRVAPVGTGGEERRPARSAAERVPLLVWALQATHQTALSWTADYHAAEHAVVLTAIEAVTVARALVGLSLFLAVTAALRARFDRRQCVVAIGDVVAILAVIGAALLDSALVVAATSRLGRLAPW